MIQPDQILAQRLADGLLSGEEERKARERMDRDPAFRALVEEVREVRALFAASREEAPQAGAPPGFSSRVALAVRAGLAGGPDLWALTRKLSWAAAAVLLLSLTVLAGFQASRGGTVLRADDLVRRYEDLLRKARLQEGPRRARLEEKLRKSSSGEERKGLEEKKK